MLFRGPWFIAGELIRGRPRRSDRLVPLVPLLVLGGVRSAAMRKCWKHASPRVAVRAGISRLPNDAGIGGRILAANGGVLARGLEAAFAVAFEA